MNFPSLSLIPKAFGDALARLLGGTAYATAGLIPTVHGVASLQVDVSAGTGFTAGGPFTYAGGNVVPGVAAATARYDLIVFANGAAVPSIVAGAASATPVPPALPAGALLIGYAFIPGNAVDYTTGGFVSDYTMPFALAAGTAAAPALSWVGSLTTGFFRPIANVIGFAISGVERARLDANGFSMDGGASYLQNVMPNLILNSDFARRTVLGLAMPEVFTDLLGTTKVDAGAAGAVAGNIFTQGAANNEYAWCNQAFVWKTGRASATFKATAVAGIYELKWKQDATHWVAVKQNNGNFTLVQSTAGVDAVQVTVGQALTLNRWYWLEIDVQESGTGGANTTVTVKIYDTGGTVPGVTKAASTLLATLTNGIQPAQNGAHIAITSDQAAAQWGGIAAGNGGVYVETWLPESWNFAFAGTLGGQAIGIDESVDAGPIGKQWALRGYIPATSRIINATSWDGLHVGLDHQDLIPSMSYAVSWYSKVAGKGGAGNLLELDAYDYDLAGGNPHFLGSLGDGGLVVWTRQSFASATAATGRTHRYFVLWNGNSTATGTAYLMLPQWEQGIGATPWRPAPADDTPINFEIINVSGGKATASGVYSEFDPRDGAITVFLPYDCDVEVAAQAMFSNTAAGNITVYNFSVDGVDWEAAAGGIFNAISPSINGGVPLSMRARKRLAAGKHRIALRWKVTAGTTTQLADAGAGSPSLLALTATRGK